MQTGRIYLFPSSLGDVPPSEVLPQRNIELLRGVRHFVVEELRTARRFLKACDRSIVIDDHTSSDEVEAMLAPALTGEDIGVISEAGCPAVADPGADLVAAAQRRGIEICPLVGPSSILLSLMASGFNGQSFAFEGYLPIDAGRRAARLREMEKSVRTRRQTQIFIETPYRNNRLVAELARTLSPDMLLCVAADLTGPRQSVRTLSLRRWRNETYDYDKIPAIFLIYS